MQTIVKTRRKSNRVLCSILWNPSSKIFQVSMRFVNLKISPSILNTSCISTVSKLHSHYNRSRKHETRAPESHSRLPVLRVSNPMEWDFYEFRKSSSNGQTYKNNCHHRQQSKPFDSTGSHIRGSELVYWEVFIV